MSNVDEDGLVVEELDGDLQPAGGARGERHRLQQSKVNINPKTKENREQYKREMLELLQPAFAAYHRSFKEHADKYVTEERITRFTKKTRLPLDDLHVAAAFDAMLVVTPSKKHKTLIRWYDKACDENPARGGRAGVDKLLDKLTLEMAREDLDRSTAPIRQAVRDVPKFVTGFGSLIQRFLDEVLQKIVRDAWEAQEEKSQAAIRQRLSDAVYGGSWQ